ncbi:MAG TPA: calcium/sodium antiporter [Thermoanaerobaculia bacterium]|nr:calcium/sodium antiporter [Thermoanaerobaculia bacterium]
MTQLLAFAAGLVLLYYGAEWLVRGSARIARALGITPLVIGLTVVAFGTSAPELVVSVLASMRGESNVALGNVVGSNILNIALILGLSAVIHPLLVQSSLVARELPVMIGATLAIAVVGWNGSVSRVEGVVFLACFVLYLWFVVALARRAPQSAQIEYDEYEVALKLEPAGESRQWDYLLVAGGLAALVVGAHLLVTAAVAFARMLGISDLVIALTVVAVGTSLPELATSAIAAMRGEADIAVGNIVGSNIFNVLLILGAAAAVNPLAVDPGLLRFEIPVCIAVSAILLPFALTRLTIERWEGAVLLAAYVAFTAYIVMRAI